MRVAALTVYPTRRTLDGERIESFDQLIAAQKLDSPDLLIRNFESGSANQPWSARLYLWPGAERTPSWVGFLEEGFGGDLGLSPGTQHNAVITVRIFYRTERFFAVTFGGGRHNLREGVIDAEYSLRVALNAIYEGDEDATRLDRAERVQQVETRTVGANTMRTLRQANRSTDFEDFETDFYGDQLNAITGRTENALLGRRVSGGRSLRLGRTIEFHELGEVCRELARYHERSDYKRRFQFVDTYRRVSDLGTIRLLSEAAVESLIAQPELWAFAPPGLIDFERIDAFLIEGLEEPVTDPDAHDIVEALTERGESTWDGLKGLHVQAIDAAGQVVESWSAVACLDGQIALDATTTLLEAGDFIEIEPGYLAALDTFIDDIPEAEVDLPDAVMVRRAGKLKEIDEGTYNQHAAAYRPEHFLLDKRTVTVPGKTSAIEICDVLTTARQFVHVKRKLSSSSLSHLFGQGFVSAELLVDNIDYRRAIRQVIGTAYPNFRNLVVEASAVGADYEVVYAIVAKWDSDALTAIPFFSKINLRKHTQALRRMGFRVSHARVHVVAPT